MCWIYITVIPLCCFINTVDIKQNVISGIYSELNSINPYLFIYLFPSVHFNSKYLSAVVLLFSHKVVTFFIYISFTV